MSQNRGMFARSLVLVLTVVVLGTAAACGGDDDDGGESDSTTPAPTQEDGDATVNPTPNEGEDDGNSDVAAGVDACDLLTQEEVGAALGTAAAAPQRGASGPYETCTWNTEEISLKFVIVQVHSGVSREEFLEQQQTTATLLDEDSIDVDGLGDAAYEMGGFLYAHEGDFELVLTNILGLNAEDPDEAAQALEINSGLMEAALSRLP